MIVDRSLIITYANTAIIELMLRLERFLPISADQLVGSSFALFHRELASTRELPDALRISLGPEWLDLRIDPLFGQRRERVGFVITCDLATERGALAARHEALEQLVSTASMRLIATAAVLSRASVQGAAGASKVAENALRVASAAVALKANIAAVTSAAAQLTAAIPGLAAQAASAASAVQGARSLATLAQDACSCAVRQSVDVGQATKAVTSVALQTKLLALNASIEATRGGVSGTGFAVVAGEVKALARENAEAVEAIAVQISAMATKAASANQVVAQIAPLMKDVVGLATSMSAGLDDQAEVARDVAQRAVVVSSSVDEVGQWVGVVTAAGAQCGSASRASQAAIDELDDLARGLRAALARHDGRVKAA